MHYVGAQKAHTNLRLGRHMKSYKIINPLINIINILWLHIIILYKAPQ